MSTVMLDHVMGYVTMKLNRETASDQALNVRLVCTHCMREARVTHII